MKLSKFFVIAFNICFLFLSVAMISSASSIRFIFGGFYEIITAGNNINGLNIIWISSGFVLSAIGIYGLCSALKESASLMNLYTIILSLTLILQIVTATTANNLNGELDNIVSDSLKRLVQQYGKNQKDTSVMDSIQREYSCCGYSGPSDWMGKYRTAKHFTTDNERTSREDMEGHIIEDDNMMYDRKKPHENYFHGVPKSCCKNRCENYYSRGCFKLLSNDITQVVFMVKSVAMFASVLQIFGVLAAYMFGRTTLRE